MCKRVLLLNREKILLNIVLHDLTKKILRDIRILIFETSGLDCSTIDGEGVVVKKLGIEVRSKRSAGNTGSSAHLTPWLKVLIISLLNEALEVKTSSIADKRTIETSGDAKDGLEDLVDLLLIGIVLISKVVKSASRNIDSAVPHGSGNITHVNSAKTKITRPHELHLLLQVLVNSSADETRSNTTHITRAINSRRTKNDKRKSSESPKVSLSLKVSLGKHGPWLSLVTLLGRLLACSINLCSAKVHEFLDGVLHSLLSNLHANVMELLLVDRLILTVLGLSSAVKHVVELLAIIASKALCNGASVGKITLDELNDGVGKKSGVSSVKECSLREDLIDATNLSDSASPHKELAKVTANEASTTENENSCHFSHCVFKKNLRAVSS